MEEVISMNKRIKKKHKWEYYHKKFEKILCETRKEAFKFVVNKWARCTTIQKCRSLKCGYVYRRNVKRAAKWAVENDIRSLQTYLPYRHLRFARHLQPPKEKDNNE